MSSLTITLPDGSQQSAAVGTRPIDVAKSVSPRLAADAIVARVNGDLWDLTRPLEGDAKVEILTTKNPEALQVYRHSTAHLLAAAVLELFPETQLGIGPPTDSGFYYDFQRETKFTPEDLEKIEARMRELQSKNLPFERKLTPKQEGLEKYRDDWMKRELIEERAGDIFSEYTLGPNFIDFCRGPHVPSTEKLRAFKLLSIAGAYWKGNEKNPQLQRIYGTAFFTQKELDEYLRRLEEARKRDHRKLGKELELFTISDLVGSGLPLWLPKGATVRRVLEEYILERERATGYEHVYTPALAKVELYQKSGHWEHYHEDMFPPMDLETEQMVLRPMNCPHHILIFKSKMRSYRDLPVRLAELGTMYRYERSGVLSGLSRVRCMTLNDAHIFCTPDQIKSEFTGVMKLVEEAYRALGIMQYSYRLSLRDKNNTEKYVANDEMWDLAERVLREAMDSLGLRYTEAPGEAAFYGPKLDIQLADVMGHEETYSTIQIDFHLPNRFELGYIGADGHSHRPVMIHRAIVSTMERMVSYLIELYGGAFPVWLAPVQAIVLPIADRQNEYARQVHAKLTAAGLRAEIDQRSDKINAKIREAQLQKIPYMLVVGDREMHAGQVSVRNRKHGDQGARGIDEFVAHLSRLNAGRSLEE
ncbi:MAG TPA: threonine--tRNA ligase [Bryobacteraceae bacterium]|jgi:threonyl-tRNA synthetase|nr:threonine--tRNA ligase [Bryobacteraceae bacterium]